MAKPEFQLFPCIVCTLGYNTYVAGHRLISKGAQLLTTKTTDECAIEQIENNVVPIPLAKNNAASTKQN